MQFFPDTSVSALGGVSILSGSSGKGTDGGSQFLSSLNAELAASGVTPVMGADSATGPPTRFRQIKRDTSATLDNEDVGSLLGKFRKRGVDDSALTGIEGLLSSGSTLTIGNIRGALRGNGRTTGDVTADEMTGIESALQKLQFSAEDSDEILGLMMDGRGFEAMQRIKKQAASLGEGSFSLNKEEVSALARGLDVSAKGMEKISALLDKSDAEIDADSLEAMLAPATEEISRHKAALEKATTLFKEVMDETLSDKKTQERTAPVSDTRGSQLTERSETRMRDDLTAKGNGLGPKSQEEIEEEEAALADQRAFDQRERSRKDEASGQRTVSTSDSGRDKAQASAEKAPSSTRENFSPLLNRLEVSSGMTMPAQTQTTAQTQQNTATTAFAHRQEILNQVEQGMLRQLSDGTRQMTLQLNPGELGHLTVVLSVKSGEVRALIRADNPETTAALSEQMSQLRATLEEQGLKVAQLDVETQLPQDTTQDQWTDMGQFNREQEMREQARFQRLSKLRQDSGESRSASEPQMEHTRQEKAETGLHIVA